MNKNFWQPIEFAYRALLNNGVRTFLTVLGIVIGIAAVIIVFSAGEGIKSFVGGQLAVFGNDYLVVEVKVPNTAKNSSANATGISQGVSITTLTREDYEEIKKIPLVKNAYSAVMGQSLVSYAGTNKQIFLMGTTYEVDDIDPGELILGRGYSEDEDKSLARVAVLGYQVKEDLFGNDNPLGKNIKINRLSFQVIGVNAKKGSAGAMNLDDQIFVPLGTLQKQIMGIDHISFIMVQYADARVADQLAEDVTLRLRERHDISDPSKDDFGVTTQAEAMDLVNSILGGVQLLLVSLAAISLVVGGIGIMNIMYVSVSERTFEIGLRKAVGATAKDILWQFLWEALAVTFLGGLIGFIVGVLITWLISALATWQGIAWPFSLPLFGVFMALFSSTVIGLIFGIYPARKAAALDPITALRQE